MGARICITAVLHTWGSALTLLPRSSAVIACFQAAIEFLERPSLVAKLVDRLVDRTAALCWPAELTLSVIEGALPSRPNMAKVAAKPCWRNAIAACAKLGPVPTIMMSKLSGLRNFELADIIVNYQLGTALLNQNTLLFAKKCKEISWKSLAVEQAQYLRKQEVACSCARLLPVART